MYKVENLSFKYKKSKQNTLSNISFSLTNGKLNVLVGENGAGKTTIMDCIAGINKTIYDNSKILSTKGSNTGKKIFI